MAEVVKIRTVFAAERAIERARRMTIRENAPRVLQALAAFGAPLGEITEADVARPGVVYQIGVPPGRIDILTEPTGLTFEQTWPDRIRRPFAELEVDFIDRASFLHNKRATGRLRLERHRRDGVTMTDNLENLTIDAFESRVGERFRIRAQPGDELEAELIEARALGKAVRDRRVPFTLSFRTPQLAALRQRIYEVAHEEMGSYDIFLVPVGPDGKGMVYEAIFT